jgi:hypothetical protein
MTELTGRALGDEQARRREAGQCIRLGCDSPHQGRTMGWCKEHGGVMVPGGVQSKRHAPLQMATWKKYQ